MADDLVAALLEQLWGTRAAGAEDVEALVRLLRDLPVSPEERKYVLTLFCDRAGVVPTRALYEAAGASLE